MGNETSRPAEAEADGGDAGPADTRRPSTASSVLSRGETTSPTSATVAKGSVLSSLRSRIPVSAATTAAVMTATAATATGSDKERGAFFAGFDSVPSRELRPVFSALMAQAVHAATTTAAPLQSSSQKPILITELQQRLPSVVRVFIAAGDSDWEWERNALAKDVWPFLRRFCRVLNLDFEAVDLKWNVPDEGVYADPETAQKALKKCIDESFGPAFFCFLGDRYGRPALPTTIPASTLDPLLVSLDESDAQTLHTWYTLDTNTHPAQYRLQPTTQVIPGASSADPVTRSHAQDAWKAARRGIVDLLREGCDRAPGLKGGDLYNAVYSSATDLHVGWARMEREREVLVVGESDYLDRFYSFQRTFSKAPTADTASPLYFDSHPASLAALHAQLRANRTYSVPWNATEGFNPSVDKSHAAYLKTFCDDSARILAETVLRQYAAREESMDALELEVADHARVARGLAETFVGRIGVLEEMERVLRGDSTHALVIYGPAGIGKSALLAKLIHDVRDPENPLHHAVFVSRFVGATRDASNLHSLVSSVCEQIARMYGVDNMRARITEEIESLGEAADPASAGLSEELFGLLEFWPPMSPAGLKTGLWVAMGLASPEKPLVLIIDGLYDLTSETDALNLDWLPAVLPPYVKLIFSAQPVSKKQSLFLSLCSKYPAASAITPHDPSATTARYLELGPLTAAETQSQIDALLAQGARSLNAEQSFLLESKAKATGVPLYAATAWSLHARRWSSDFKGARRALQAETVAGLFEDALDALEGFLGRVFVGRAVGYLAAARDGLSLNELTDVLSTDADVIVDMFKSHEPTVLRLNACTVAKVIEELGNTLFCKIICGMEVYFWSSSIFKTVATSRYLHDDRAALAHRALANYWRDKQGKDAGSKMVKHYVFNQTLLISGKPNARRIASVAWHLLHGGVPSMGEAVKTLQNISYLGAAIDGDLLDEVLECYKYALENLGDTVYSAQLTEYYRFLVNNYGALSKSSRQLIPLAANLYTTSVISGDVRSWVKSRAPDLNWAEWVNRPTSRGEPIAWMKSQEPSQELTVTSRDTFGNMIVVAGIRVSDMQSSLMLFEVDYKSTAVLPEHRSRLRRVTVLDLPREEQQMPLTCSFSRSGRMIAVAARSLMFVQTSDLALVRCVEDPSLPEGDIITAIAWTKDDGCVVTASDGSEPGRIVLWDAGSFSLLRAIKSQYPRQPICTSYATMGFWDEYRDLFILLDVDELASDAESGLFLQYIPTKSHSDPPLDGCARFALAHKAPLVLVANDEGKGYTLIDFRAKKPVARAEVDIDTVRYVALSADGTKIGIVPVEGKVIHILGLAEPLDKSNASKEAPDLPLFVHMGTILGSAETEQPVCLFSRNRLTIITDGDVGSTQVWAINDLGDHSTVRYISLLPALSQGLCPVVNSSNVLGWAITENRTEVSMSDSKAKAKARTYDVVAEDTYNAPKQGLMYKDLVVAIASHPEKPFTAVVTDKGQLTLLYNDSISLDPRKWIRGLWTTKKVEDGLIASFNLCQGSPTSVVFVPTAPVAGDRNGVNLNAETLSFVTGHEDGMLFLWEWSSMLQTDEIQPMRSMKLNNGRITSLAGAHAGSHTVAATLDETTVVIWDGKSNDLGSVSVLIAPVDSNNFNRGSVSMASNHHRWSASSLWSSTGLSDYSLSRPTIVSFSSTSDKVLVTGDEGGIITIWSLESKMKRQLVSHPDKPSAHYAVIALSWSLDDATVVSLSEDKRISIHNAGTGELVWVHDLWMITTPLKTAAFVFGARQLSIIDIYGSLTLVQLHGKWPSSKVVSKTRIGAVRNLLTSSATRVANMISAGQSNADAHPITTAGISAEPQELEEFEMMGWNFIVSSKLLQNKADLNTRSSDMWQFTTGSGSHGHVGLLRLDSGLPRGVFEVICEIEIPAAVNGLQTGNQSIQLQFVCGAAEDSNQVIDPELEVLRGFTRFFPVEEQKQLAGMGRVNLRLGYLKTLASINTCYIDLKRIPGEGEMFKLGSVHFVPADPSVYTPLYNHPPELREAFKKIGKAFKEFEARHRRRSSILNLVVSERLSHSASIPDLKQALVKASTEFDEATAAQVVMSPDSVASNESSIPDLPKPAAASRLSMLQPLSSMVSSVSGFLGTASVPAVRAPPYFDAIQKEMEEARRKANEEAKRLEEEEEAMAAALAKERENAALRAAFEQNAKDTLQKMIKGEKTDTVLGHPVGGYTRASFLLTTASSASSVSEDAESRSVSRVDIAMESLEEEIEDDYDGDDLFHEVTSEPVAAPDIEVIGPPQLLQSEIKLTPPPEIVIESVETESYSFESEAITTKEILEVDEVIERDASELEVHVRTETVSEDFVVQEAEYVEDVIPEDFSVVVQETVEVDDVMLRDDADGSSADIVDRQGSKIEVLEDELEQVVVETAEVGVYGDFQANGFVEEFTRRQEPAVISMEELTEQVRFEDVSETGKTAQGIEAIEEASEKNTMEAIESKDALDDEITALVEDHVIEACQLDQIVPQDETNDGSTQDVVQAEKIATMEALQDEDVVTQEVVHAEEVVAQDMQNTLEVFITEEAVSQDVFPPEGVVMQGTQVVVLTDEVVTQVTQDTQDVVLTEEVVSQEVVFTEGLVTIDTQEVVLTEELVTEVTKEVVLTEEGVTQDTQDTQDVVLTEEVVSQEVVLTAGLVTLDTQEVVLTEELVTEVTQEVVTQDTQDTQDVVLTKEVVSQEVVLTEGLVTLDTQEVVLTEELVTEVTQEVVLTEEGVTQDTQDMQDVVLTEEVVSQGVVFTEGLVTIDTQEVILTEELVTQGTQEVVLTDEVATQGTQEVVLTKEVVMQDVILTEEIDTYNGEIINANTDTIIAYDDEIITVGSQQSICYSYLCNHVGDSVNQACYSYVHSPLRLHGSVTVSSSGAIQGKTIDETMKTFTRNKSQIIQKELVNVQKLDKAANQDIVGDQVIVEESVVTEAAVLAELSNHHVENADDIVVEEVRTVLTEAEVAAEIGSGISPDEDEIVIEESSAAVYNGDAYKNDRAIHVTELEDDIEVRALESQLEKASALTTTQETQSALSTSSFLDNIDSFFSADVSPVEDTPSGLDSFLTESSSLDFDLSKYSISSKFDTKAPVAEIEDETHEVVEEVLESRMVWPSEIEIDRLDEAISDETHVVESLETEEVVVDVPPARNESAASEVAVPSIHQGLDDKEGAAGLITENLLEFNAVEPEIDFVKAEGGFEGNNGEPVAQFQEAAPETDESAPVPADNVYNDLNRGENEDASIELKKLMDTEFADELAPSTESRDDMDAYFSSESIALPNSSEEPGSDFDLAVDFVAPSESREELEARDVDQLENPVELRDELDVYFAQPAEPITSDALYDMGLGEPDDSEAHEELDLEEPADSDARYELGNGEPTDSDKRDEFEAYFSSEPPGDSSVPEDELDEYFNIGDNTDLTAIADPSLNLGDQETDEDELDAYFSEDTSVPTQIDEPVEDVANPKTLDPLLKQPFADDLVGTEQPTRAFIADTIGQDNAGLKFDNDAAESEEVDGEDDFDFGDYGAEEAAEVEPLEAADPDPDAAAVDTDFDFDDYGIDEPFSGEASEEHDAGAV